MGEITQLLMQSQAGDEPARAALFQAVYFELRKIAGAKLAAESTFTQLDSASLVNELYLKLVAQKELPTANRRAFFAYAAAVMRSVIVDTARARNAEKRGGGVSPITLVTGMADENTGTDAEALDSALQQLKVLDERSHEIVQLRYFGGLSLEEVAEHMQLSLATVKRDWQKARAVLYRLLSPT